MMHAQTTDRRAPVVQADLFADARARNTDPVTSHRAAVNVHRFANGHYCKILAALQQGPADRHGIARRTGLRDDAVGKRLTELAVYGKVHVLDDTGKCRLWELAPPNPDETRSL